MPKTGRPGGNPELKNHGWKRKDPSGVLERKVLFRVSEEQYQKAKTIKDLPTKFRAWLDEL